MKFDVKKYYSSMRDEQLLRIVDQPRLPAEHKIGIQEILKDRARRRRKQKQTWADTEREYKERHGGKRKSARMFDGSKCSPRGVGKLRQGGRVNPK